MSSDVELDPASTIRAIARLTELPSHAQRQAPQLTHYFGAISGVPGFLRKCIWVFTEVYMGVHKSAKNE